MSLKMTQFSIGTTVFEQIRGSPMGSPLSPALCMMVVALSEEIWVPNLPYHPQHHGSYGSPPSLCGQQTVLVGPLLGLRNLLRQFPAPGVLRPSYHFGNGTGPGVLGFLHRVRAFCPSLQPSTRLQPGHGAILRITFGRPTFGFCFTIISGRQMRAPCTRTNTRFCPHCTVCTDLQVLPSPTLSLLPSRSVNICTFPHLW